MNKYLFLFSSLILLISCEEENPFNKLRLTRLSLYEFNDSTQIAKWDSLDGPDIFVTISINDSIVFITDSMEHINVASAPVNFQLDSNIVFQQGKEEITINVYDKDEFEDQLMQKSFSIQPGAVFTTPETWFVSCGACLAIWETTYEIVK